MEVGNVKKSVLLIPIFALSLLAGCSNEQAQTDYKKEGKEELNAGNYSEAAGLFKLAIKEDSTDKEAKKLLDEAKDKAAEQSTKETKEKEVEAQKQQEEQTAKEVEKQKEDENLKYVYAQQYDIGQISDDVTMSEMSLNFAIAHYDLFPAMSNDKILEAKNSANRAVLAGQIKKNVASYQNHLATFAGNVVQISEQPVDDTHVATWMLVEDENYDYHELLMYKSTGDIIEGDHIRFYGLPLGLNYFENQGGGTTETILYLGAHVEKE